MQRKSMVTASNQIEKADTVREIGSALSSAGHRERKAHVSKKITARTLLLIHLVGIIRALVSFYIGRLNQIAA